ncbi:MAG TPA: anti-sigma factor [Solirubrobacteraceae bacterium]|nr:anti-sigma factor [Solirubrobacteraceae bacterium]
MNEDSSHMDPTHGLCPDDAAPYVLGALTDAEHEAFVEHLRTCAICREEVAALSAIAAALPVAVPARPASPALKSRVMADVNAEARRLAAASGARERRRSTFRWRPLLAPLAAGVALLAVALAIVLGGGRSSPRVIRAQVLAPGAKGFVRISGAHAELTLLGMPQPSPGRVYELWIKRAGAPQPTDALFTVGSGGRANVGVPGSVAGVKVVMVTSEPLGGSEAPTRQPAVVARLD